MANKPCTNCNDALKKLVEEADAMVEFFQTYVPLRDSRGMSLHEDWSWGPLEAALKKAKEAIVT